MTGTGRRTLDPLRIVGTELPPNSLLTAKLMVLGLMLHGYLGKLPEPYLPMWPIFDHVSRPDLFRHGLQITFVLGAIGVLLGRFVRTGAFLCGAVFFLEPLVNRLVFYYADFFCACTLLLVALHTPRVGPWLIRGQYAVMYFGSGLNKLLDPDWRSGHFMDHFLGQWVKSRRYELYSNLLPERWGTLLVSWGTIATELGIAVLVLVPRLRAVAIWTIVIFHASSVVFTRADFGIFVAGILAGLPALALWPAPGSVLVRYDGRRPFLRGFRQVISRVHRDGLFAWIPEERAPVAADGRPTLIRVDIGKRSHAGLAAVNRLLLLTPLVLLAVATLLTAPKPSRTVATVVLEATLATGILLFLPLTERAFRWATTLGSTPRPGPATDG